MTVKEYIVQKFQSFGMELSEAEILDITLSSGVNQEENITGENIHPVTVAIVEFIPDLLLRPTSFSEGDLSMSWGDNEKRIKAWYSLRCEEYGIEDRFSNKSKVTFL